MYLRKKAAAFISIALLSTMLFANTAFGASYTVQKNDSLYKIGLKFNTSVAAIKAENNLKGDTIYPGQVLSINTGAYTVKSGDSLYLIAMRHGITVDALRKANNKWDNMIYPGQKLVIPSNNSSGGGASSQGKPVVSYTQAELDLLARLIRAEAESEPYAAQVAVASVVVNRIKSNQFPDTISSVIYEVSNGYYQFTPVENGWINKPATAQAKKAALEALNGSDPSNGALFYFDDSATNKWLWSKPITARIGRMVYVY
jgi:N-acetylmuramoyl-L-alanine amidase